MGLLEDIIGGMLTPQAGGRSAPGGPGAGMSPIMMALLAFLAQRAMSGGRGAPGGEGSAISWAASSAVRPSPSGIGAARARRTGAAQIPGGEEWRRAGRHPG